MPSLNKVMIIGRLGKDPETKYTPDGTPVCRMSVATSETWKDKHTGEKRERTEWHRLVVWRRLAEICGQYLHKGSMAYFEGQLQTQQWEKDGEKRYSTEIVVGHMQILDGKGGMADAVPQQQGSGVPVEDDDIPF